ELAAAGVPLGAYVVRPAAGGGRPDLVLIGTGSELQHCLGAADLLAAEGIAVQVVSMPSWDLFEGSPADHRASVLPEGVPRLAVEAASSFGWERYADATVAIDHYGASASAAVNMEKFGFTAPNVADHARRLLSAGA
ncbi:MAG TPA: transketolase C-terminal domain-containing protein, partial [Acidimicrobiales bacterium]|nr:transketolase C-terminal domain-containing protein [Acidimicrobiales bacterium]